MRPQPVNKQGKTYSKTNPAVLGGFQNMKIAIAKERRAHESRVAASPETVRKLIDLGYEIVVEKGAGLGSDIPDQAFKDAGADVAASAAAALKDADILLKVQRPIIGGKDDETEGLRPGLHVISVMDPLRSGEDMAALAAKGVTAFAMDLVPRITRAQSMDVLSSQANLAGYRAVLEAAAVYGKSFPMLMTAAGTIHPAKAMVMGAGVAGLQAIATARRLGAIVSATDVRPAAKEQVESLGASFVAVEDEEFKEAETAGGYAKEMSDAYKQKQAELIAETVKKQDIVITTALIPGRPAPRLITQAMVETMKPGSVIVDMAVENGGNCEVSKAGKVVTTKNGVKVVGYENLAGRLASEASALYARNLLSFLQLLTNQEEKKLEIDWDDEIVQGCLIARDGKVVHPALAPAEPPAEEPKQQEAPDEAPSSAAESEADTAAGSEDTSAGEGGQKE